MGWTVLYVGFGFVALWLLGEVLLQYKARLRWRLLAFTGFLGVVVGVLLHSVPVIVMGAIAFAVGQLYVTLSFRQGFSTGWAIGGSPRVSRRRRGSAEGATKEPTLEVSDLEYGPADQDAHDPQDENAFPQHGQDQQGEQSSYGTAEQPAYSEYGYSENAYAQAAYQPVAAGAEESTGAGVYAPQPLPDDTGQYGIYSDTAYGAAAQYGSGEATGPDQHGQQYPGQYGYGADQQQYAAYSDPYIGAGQPMYDNSYGGRQQYADPYAEQYANDTPPGGVWVPQQRDTEPPFGAPDQPPNEPHHNGYHGYPDHDGQQHRY